MLKVGRKIRCVKATCSEERLTLDKIYTLLGYDPKGDYATFKVEDDIGCQAWWGEDRFVEAIEVGDKVKCLDTFYIRQCMGFFHPGKIFTVKKILFQGNKQYLYPDEHSEINCDESDVELVEEKTMFEIGERIRCTRSVSHPEWLKEGKVYVVCGHNDSERPLVIGEDGSRIDINWGTFVKEPTMSKYQEKKEQIENLQNGWDKEADDILRTLLKPCTYRLEVIRFGDGSGRIKIHNWVDNGLRSELHLSGNHSQHDWMEKFKQSLLWLLDHSDIKNEEKIGELEKKLVIAFQSIVEIKKQIEELRR